VSSSVPLAKKGMPEAEAPINSVPIADESRVPVMVKVTDVENGKLTTTFMSPMPEAGAVAPPAAAAVQDMK
jgi:hypothetical protein